MKRFSLLPVPDLLEGGSRRSETPVRHRPSACTPGPRFGPTVSPAAGLSCGGLRQPY